MQGADGWQLIRNLTDSVERALLGRSGLLKDAAATLAPAAEPESAPPAPLLPTRAERAKASRRQVRLERYQEVVRLRRNGMSKREIARTVGLSRKTVATWLTPDQRRYMDALTDLRPEIRLMHLLAQEFRRMFKERDASALGRSADAARLSLLRGFAAGVHSDVAAVRAAISLPWSNGRVERHVNRLNLVKRQMYGRAGFDLLTERVLHAA